jgi:hypothetical protein
MSDAGVAAAVAWTWDAEPPVAAFVAVAGTPCRCTVSRRAVERIAGAKRLGPAACHDAIECHRARIELIAACKYARDGVGPGHCIHVTSADVAAAAPGAAPARPETPVVPEVAA